MKEPAEVFSRRMSHRLLIPSKCVLAVILLGWLVHRVDVTRSLEIAASASVPLLLVAYALDLLGCLLVAQRWTVLLQANGTYVPLCVLMRSVMVSNFFNNFLPSTVGGDAMRAYDSYQLGQSRGTAVSAVLVDRLLGLVALSFLALCGLLLVPELAGRQLVLTITVGFFGAGVAAATWAIFSSSAPSILSRVRLPSFSEAFCSKFSAAFGPYRGKSGVLARAFSLSLTLQGNVVLAYVLIAHSLGLPIAAVSFFWIVPLALFIMMVPITINGIGLRENALIILLGLNGIAGSEALAYAWLVYSGNLVWGLVGGVVYALRR